MKLPEIVEEYISLRDKKKIAKQKYDEYIDKCDARMELLHDAVRDKVLINGNTSRNTVAGSVKQQVNEKFYMDDALKHRKWVLEDPESRIVTLQKRLAVTEIADIVKEEKKVPTGVRREAERVVIFSRPRKKKVTE